MATVEEIQQCRREVESLARQMAEADGELKQLLNRLKSLKFSSYEHAREQLPRLRAEYERLAKDRDAKLTAFWESHKDRLGTRPT